MENLAAIRDSIYKGSSRDSVKYTKMELEKELQGARSC